MYAYVKGTLESISENQIIVDCHDIGYSIYVPASVISQLPPRGSEVKIFTYLHVKEDAMDLFGFLSMEDKNVFQLLIGVSGIGPKGACNILSVLSPDELRFAVLSGDDKAISKAPGIGKKIAQKLIIELKDKLDFEDILGNDNHSITSNVENSISIDARNDAIAALVSLGYSSSESMKVVSSVDLTVFTDTESILKEALKKMAF